MKSSTLSANGKHYAAPAVRFLNVHLEKVFLKSNTEPIEGGDDPEIDW